MSQANQHDSIRPIQWVDDQLLLLDQRELPGKETYLVIQDVNGVYNAIHSMVVRGAPAIGITAAYGVVLSARAHFARKAATWLKNVEHDVQRLRGARPTAVNLDWALNKMLSLAKKLNSNPVVELLACAHNIRNQDIQNNRRMGDIGAEFILPSSLVLTHCNAGALATGGYGTALGVIRSAFTKGRVKNVFACETRPWLQGARLTAWELAKEKIRVTLLADSAASHLLKTVEISWIIVGADRVAANGDVANKIGTYGLAVLAKYHGVKVMVVAPTSTIDICSSNGSEISLESRGPEELFTVDGRRVAATGAKAWNPIFDITPAALVDVLVTEKGAIYKPTIDSIAEVVNEAPLS